MVKPRNKEKGIHFPYVFEKNGRTGRIKKWGDGKFGTYFLFAGEKKRNSFGSFESAFNYLDGEFSKLDTNSANSLTLHPLRNDVKTYHELEEILRERGDGASLRETVEYYLANFETKRFFPKKVSECIDSFLSYQKEENISPMSSKTFEKHLRRFEKDFGTRNIHQIETLEIAKWLHQQKYFPAPLVDSEMNTQDRIDKKNGKKWSANTRIKVRGSLVSLSLFSQGTLKSIPNNGKTEFQKVKNPKKDERPAVEIYTPEEAQTLLVSAMENDIDLIPAIVAGCFFGLRPFEFHAEGLKRDALKWELFNWNDNLLHFKGQKIREKSTRDIPIKPNAKAWLEPFIKVRGHLWNHKKSYDIRMEKLREKAKVSGIRDGFRHSYASYRVRELKNNLDQLAGEMGNSPAEIIDSYKRNVTDKEAAAWFSIEPPSEYAEKIKNALQIKQAPAI